MIDGIWIDGPRWLRRLRRRVGWRDGSGGVARSSLNHRLCGCDPFGVGLGGVMGPVVSLVPRSTTGYVAATPPASGWLA